MAADKRLNRRTMMTGSSAVAVLGSGFSNLPAWATSPPPLTSLFGGPFSLIDHHGKSRTDRDFRGKYMLIFFGYTYCPDICPLNLQHGADALQTLDAKIRDQIVPIFVSIDPERDTPDVLKEYVANFSDQFVGLTGSEQQIRAISKAYRIHRRKVLPVDETNIDNYLVDHSSITYLMGPDGKFVTLFPHNTSVEKMSTAISGYLAA